MELDVSAPQILFAEELCERDASVLVVDFGRLRLTNATPAGAATPPADDEELFMTPCSTPPASLLSPAEPPGPAPQAPPPLDSADLHTRLYDRCAPLVSRDVALLRARRYVVYSVAGTR